MMFTRFKAASRHQNENVPDVISNKLLPKVGSTCSLCDPLVEFRTKSCETEQHLAAQCALAMTVQWDWRVEEGKIIKNKAPSVL